MSTEAKIKNADADGLLVIGAKSVLSKARSGDLDTIVLASNCPEHLVSEVEHVASVSGIDVDKFGSDSRELGELCRKPFTISVLGLGKSGN